LNAEVQVQGEGRANNNATDKNLSRRQFGKMLGMQNEQEVEIVDGVQHNIMFDLENNEGASQRESVRLFLSNT